MNGKQLGPADLMEAGAAFVTLMEALPPGAIDAVQGLEAWALSWGPRLMDEVDRLSRQVNALPEPGSRELFRVWVDRRGFLKAAVDLPEEGDHDSSGEFEDEAHFVAVYELLSSIAAVAGNMLKAMRGKTQ